MTSYGPPPGGQPWGAAPPNGPYGGPAVDQRPAFPLWPIILVTLIFSLFGLIPTIIASTKASERRESSARYWIAFVVSLIGAFILYAIVIVIITVFVLAGTVAVVGAAVNSLPTYTGSFPTPTSGTGTAGPGATTGPCGYTPDGTSASSVDLPDDPATTPTDTRTWTLVTSAGTIVIELDGASAPCTVQSIVHLTETGFYDNTPCPRVVASGLFVLQCGDPSGNGTGGPGYTFGDENLVAADYSAGKVAMANSGPDTNGSQFFLIDKDANGSLPPNYTTFGTVRSGLDVVDKIVAGGNDGSNPAGGGAPNVPVSIVTATVG